MTDRQSRALNLVMLAVSVVLVIVALLFAPAGCGPAPAWVSPRGVEFELEEQIVRADFADAEEALFRDLSRIGCSDVARGSVDGVRALVVNWPEDRCWTGAAACAYPKAREVIVPPRRPEYLYAHELLHVLLYDVRGHVDVEHEDRCWAAVNG